jgi:hypothetical protein
VGRKCAPSQRITLACGFGPTVWTVCRHAPARGCNPQTLADCDQTALAGSTQKADKRNGEAKLW